MRGPGLAGGTQAVDSAPVKANASLEAVREKQPAGATGPHLVGRNEPAMPAASVIAAPAHQLRQLAMGQRRRQGVQTRRAGRPPRAGAFAEQQDPLQPRRP